MCFRKWLINVQIKSNHWRCSVKKDVVRNFAKFTEKHCAPGAACNFIKKETLVQVFSGEFCEISKNTFFIEHLRTTVSYRSVVNVWYTASVSVRSRQRRKFVQSNCCVSGSSIKIVHTFSCSSCSTAKPSQPRSHSLWTVAGREN